MLAAKRSACVAPEMNLRMQVNHAIEVIHPGFETQGRCHQKFKTVFFLKKLYVPLDMCMSVSLQLLVQN